MPMNGRRRNRPNGHTVDSDRQGGKRHQTSANVYGTRLCNHGNRSRKTTRRDRQQGPLTLYGLAGFEAADDALTIWARVFRMGSIEGGIGDLISNTACHGKGKEIVDENKQSGGNGCWEPHAPRTRPIRNET